MYQRLSTNSTWLIIPSFMIAIMFLGWYITALAGMYDYKKKIQKLGGGKHDGRGI